ncbi:MAG: hypothetical protein OEW16_02775 [Gammaproteobacteria bacterium]|nr:hypothetical protein [Gammaproteobacteria bacterium]
MDPRENEPFDREPWRRLLGTDSGMPPGSLDRRILSEARRALTPPVARWWLPASLAASVLLAVLIVQWQFADGGAPAHVTESDVLVSPAPDAAHEVAPAAAMEVPAQRRDESLAPPAGVAPPSIDLPAFEGRPLPAAAEPDKTAAAPAKQERELAREPSFDSGFVADADTAVSSPSPPPASVQAEPSRALGNLRSSESNAKPRTPEDWYAEIEALRAAGRIQEADEELSRLEAAYPGWLERRRQQNP